MSSRELSEWMAYAQVEPFGGEVDFLPAGIVAATIANVNREKGRKPYQPKDFIPTMEQHEQTVDEQIQIAAMFTAALGGLNLIEAEAE